MPTLPEVAVRRTCPVREGRRGGRRSARLRVPVLVFVVVAGAVLGGCGSSGPSPAEQAARQAFLAEVYTDDPSVGTYRSDTQLVLLGSAACDGFASGVSFQDLADHMALSDGSLPTADLGAVITAAAEHLCPAYASRVR